MWFTALAGIAIGLGTAGVGAQAQTSIHTVQAGETVYGIARQHSTTPEQLLLANPGLNPSRLHPGDELRLPVPTPTPSSPSPAREKGQARTWVKVRKGDTLSKIARENKVSLENLKAWNRPGLGALRPGDLVRISAPPPANTTPPVPVKPDPGPPPRKPAAPELLRFVGPAKDQIDSPRKNLREWEYIVVHHSGTSGGNAKVFDSYHSQQRGMENGLAYHFVIGNGTDSGDGQIEVGRRWLKQLQGGHLASESLNEISIGICLVGDFSRTRLGPRQTAALIELVQYLRRIMPERKLKFRLHREINTRPTECPGRLFPGGALHEILDQPVKD